LVLSTSLVVAAGLMYYAETDEPGASTNSMVELPNQTVGQHVVGIELRNPTRHRVKVVGSSMC
jgi:hypothetical protein